MTWLLEHPSVYFHYTPTSASWLNQVEGFFGILSKQSLSETDFPSLNACSGQARAAMVPVSSILTSSEPPPFLVSPATRRAVLRRDHEQCAVPGCRNAQFLDVHHVARRSEGGANPGASVLVVTTGTRPPRSLRPGSYYRDAPCREPPSW
jgi:hypothetical protein